MTNTVIVDGNKTLGEGDDGTVQCVEAAAIVTFPHEDTWKFVKEDEVEITSNTTSAVSLAGETGVTLTASPTITKGTGVKAKYQVINTYLIWGVICLVITISYGIFSYTNTMDIIENGVVLINYGN